MAKDKGADSSSEDVDLTGVQLLPIGLVTSSQISDNSARETIDDVLHRIGEVIL